MKFFLTIYICSVVNQNCAEVPVKDHIVRDKPKKRGSRQHKKSLNKNEKRQKRTRRYKGHGKG